MTKDRHRRQRISGRALRAALLFAFVFALAAQPSLAWAQLDPFTDILTALGNATKMGSDYVKTYMNSFGQQQQINDNRTRDIAMMGADTARFARPQNGKACAKTQIPRTMREQRVAYGQMGQAIEASAFGAGAGAGNANYEVALLSQLCKAGMISQSRCSTIQPQVNCGQDNSVFSESAVSGSYYPWPSNLTKDSSTGKFLASAPAQKTDCPGYKAYLHCMLLYADSPMPINTGSQPRADLTTDPQVAVQTLRDLKAENQGAGPAKQCWHEFLMHVQIGQNAPQGLQNIYQVNQDLCTYAGPQYESYLNQAEASQCQSTGMSLSEIEQHLACPGQEHAAATLQAEGSDVPQMNASLNAGVNKCINMGLDPWATASAP